jgi:hypothetical protein
MKVDISARGLRGPRRAANVLTALLALLAVFQFTLVLGAPFGSAAWGGQHDVLPAALLQVASP